jgi:hypothetical protein
VLWGRVVRRRASADGDLTGVAFGTGQYQYFAFHGAAGVNRLDVAIVNEEGRRTGSAVSTAGRR